MSGNQLAEPSNTLGAMTRERYHSICCQPNVFSKGALELTFSSLRQVDPPLALKVQNLMMGPCLPNPVHLDKNGPPGQKHYQINWGKNEVQRLIEALSSQPQPKLPGEQIIQRALLQDWMFLFRSLET